MQVKITHENSYSYGEEVFLEPHVIRLYPRLSPFLSIVEENIDISPKPVLTSKNIDEEGNTVLEVWFEGKTTSFRVNTNFKLAIKEQNPFGFFTNPINLGFPFAYTDVDKKALAPALDSDEKLDANFVSKLDELKTKSDNTATTFLSLLADEIYKNYEYKIREEGAPLGPNETFRKKSGSCRDFSVLFMAAARYYGIASRFVSGYKLNNKDEDFHLHSWVEVFIPGGGWRGIDPSIGLFVDNEYIPLCASYLPEKTAPIFGFTRGCKQKPKFEYKIKIETRS